MIAAICCGGGAVAGAQARVEKPADCVAGAPGSGQVVAIRDGRTIQLADGREVRLAGIEVPPAETASSIAARDRLATLSVGRSVSIYGDGGATAIDRYGRLVAYLELAGGQSLQSELIASGHALVAGRLGNAGCARQLRSAERLARTGRFGLWAGEDFRLQSAANPADILKFTGRFGIVRGKVLSVRESGATLYVNFGRRWSDDFTVTILKRNRRLFSDAALEPKSLEGRVVEVRGYVESRGGPLIEANRPEQIEIVQ